MKKLLIITAILLSSIVYSQGFQFEAYQDVKLALMEDDCGNSPYTPDILFKLSYIDDNNISLSLNHEYADLSGGDYNRTSIGLGYQLSNDYIKWKTEVETGIIFRNDFVYFPSFGATTNLTYNINDHFSFGPLIQWVRRGDIGNEDKISVFFGVVVK